MKKAIAVLAIVLMFSGAAFATNAEVIGNGGFAYQFLNVEQNALTNPALLGSYVRMATIGMIMPVLGTGPSMGAPQATGLVILGAGPGVIGIAVGPRMLDSTDNLDIATGNPGDVPISTVDIGYALDLKGIKAGLSFEYGVQNESSKNLWAASAELVDKDEAFTSNTILKVTLGAALNVGMPLDIAVALALPKYEAITKDYDNVQNKLENNPSQTWGAMDIIIDAKTEIASMLWALNVTLGNLSYVAVNWYDGNLDGKADNPTFDTYGIYTETDSNLSVDLLAGKVIKASEKLAIKLASGLKMNMYSDYKATTEDKIAGTKTIGTANADSGMMLTIPLNLAVTVEAGKFLNIENGTHTLSMGINKEAIVLDSYSDKVINAPTNENIVSKTDSSDLWNTTPVVGGIGWQYVLNEFKVQVSGGAALYASGSIQPNVAVDFAYAWK